MRVSTLSVVVLLCGAAGAAGKDTCFECHSVMEGMSEVFKDDVHYHNKLSCADCHGGDANEEDQNLSMSASRGFKVRVKRPDVPEYCGRCHSDEAFMHKYSPNSRVDQLALYRTSVHSARLGAGSPHAPQCIDCHGIHNIRAGSDPLSPANPAHVAEMCAKCHAAAAAAFKASPHATLITCTACHAGHATETAGVDMITGSRAVCAKCHGAGSEGAKTAAELARLISALEAVSKNGAPETAQKVVADNLAKARSAIHSVNPAAVKAPVDAGLAAARK